MKQGNPIKERETHSYAASSDREVLPLGKLGNCGVMSPLKSVKKWDVTMCLFLVCFLNKSLERMLTNNTRDRPNADPR